MLQEMCGHGSHEVESTLHFVNETNGNPTLVSTCQTTYLKKLELNTAFLGFTGDRDDIQ